MKNLSTLCIILFWIACASLRSYGQPKDFKYGKIDIEELKATACKIDSNAHAYFIMDNGNSNFVYMDTKVYSTDSESSRKGFQIHFERHFRIKILDNAAVEFGNIEIPLYKSNSSNSEELADIKACTYNLENGKIVESKLSKNSIFREQKSANWEIVKIAMPNVKPGSIIEVKYTINSDFLFNLREWQFQYTIPVLQSTYFVAIPEYFKYNQTTKGYFPINVKNDSRPKSFKITYIQKAEGTTVNEARYEDEIKYIESVYDFSMFDVPAFPIEKYLTTPANYLAKVEFEISYVHMPNSPTRSYTSTWESINEKLNSDEEFGMALKKTSHLTDDAATIKILGTSQLNQAQRSFDLIKNKLKWNGMRSIYTSDPLKETYKKGSGNCADINLNLVALLRELGITADPVILSTRDNGIIHPAHPSISSFNYVIALVNIDNAIYLMDATEPLSNLNLLPQRCLNDKGRRINARGSDWVELLNKNQNVSALSYDLKLKEDGILTGNTSISYKGYNALSERKNIKSFSSIEDYIKSIENENHLKITDNKIENLDSINKDLSLNYTVEFTNLTEQMGDLLYFSPIKPAELQENPFKLEKREYPVEFTNPDALMNTLTITIPDGYAVESFPKPTLVNLSDRSCRFTFNVISVNDKTFKIVYTLNTNKTVFLPEEYSDLKQFYSIVTSKLNEKIVLKKI